MFKRIASGAIISVKHFNDKKDDNPRYVKLVPYEGMSNRVKWFNKNNATSYNNFIDSICEMLTTVDDNGNATVKDRKSFVDEKFVFISPIILTTILNVIRAVSSKTFIDTVNILDDDNEYTIDDDDVYINNDTADTYMDVDKDGYHELVFLDDDNKTLNNKPYVVNLYMKPFKEKDVADIEAYIKRNIKVLHMVPNVPKTIDKKVVDYRAYSKPKKMTDNVTCIGRFYQMNSKNDEVIHGLRLKYKGATIDVATSKDGTPKINTHNLTDLLNVISPMIAQQIDFSIRYDVRVEFINKMASVTVGAK